jgi:transcriptional regulator with XRE-family HTH domain
VAISQPQSEEVNSASQIEDRQGPSMNELGRKLRIIRRQRGLSLRQVERLTVELGIKLGDPSRKISSSWIGRMERQEHSITHKSLATLEEVYGVSHDELIGKYELGVDSLDTLHTELPGLPSVALRGLTDPNGEHLLPPERWFAYFANTTLLPAGPFPPKKDHRSTKSAPRSERIYGVLGARDFTLLGFVQPGAVLEIDHRSRKIDGRSIYPSMWDRPIYFLRTHDGYHCGWCDLDTETHSLTLVPSVLAKVPARQWRYPDEVEVVGVVTRVLTRLSFSQGMKIEHVNRDQHSNSS